MQNYIIRKVNETDLGTISTIYEKIHDLQEGRQTAKEAIKKMKCLF